MMPTYRSGHWRIVSGEHPEENAIDVPLRSDVPAGSRRGRPSTEAGEVSDTNVQ
jgi:hypothetical protein